MQRILVIKLSSLGDLLHALPAVHCLKTGGAVVDWTVNSEYAGIVRRFSDVERVIPFPRRSLFRGLPEFLAALRAERYDLVADMQGLLKSASLALCARRAGPRLGPSFHREGSRLFYHDVCGPRDKNRHAVEENLDLPRKLGLPIPKTLSFPLSLPEADIAGRELKIGVIPFSRWKNKNWPQEFFVKTIREVSQKTGASAFVFAAPAEAPAAGRICAELGDAAVNMAGKTSLVELGSMLAAMDAVLTNDSGPMHLAAALGVPTVAMFGPTDPARTGPFGGGHRVLRAPGACDRMPCLSRRCGMPGPPCMERISPESASSALLELLAGKTVG